MSRTGKDIPCRVHIAIMDITAITAYPLPYSKVCDTVRPRVGKASTTRADLGRKALIDFLIPRAMLNSLVRSEEHTSELQSPCNLVCRLLLEKKKLSMITPLGWLDLVPTYKEPRENISQTGLGAYGC